MDYQKRRHKTLLSSENRKLYNNLLMIKRRTFNKTPFHNFPINRLEPNDNSCSNMKTIATDVNKLRDSQEIKLTEIDTINNKNKTPTMTNYPSIINGYLIEKYMSNKVNTYFDKIYVLNMDKRIDRWLNTKKLLDHFQIFNYKRWSGVDGSLLKGEWEKHCRKRGMKCDIRSAGAWGILTGMKNLLLDAKANGYHKILVLQDDIILHNDFNALFNKNINKIPDNWNLLYLGATQYDFGTLPYYNYQNSGRKYYYHPNGKTCGAFSVGIHSRIYDAIIKLIDARFGPFDQGCLGTIQKNFNKSCYVMQPYLVIADLKESDCRGGRNQNNHSKKFRWDLDNFSVIDPYLNNTISIILVIDHHHTHLTNILNSLINQSILLENNKVKLEIVIINNNQDESKIKNIIQQVKYDAQPERITIKLYQCPMKFSKTVCYNLGLGLSTGFFITFQDTNYLSKMTRLSQQFTKINEYRVELSVGKENGMLIPNTLFYSRLILNQIGYFENNHNNYLDRLLLKYRYIKTDDIIEEVLDDLETCEIKSYGRGKIEYYSFLKEYDENITRETLPKLMEVVLQTPLA